MCIGAQGGREGGREGRMEGYEGSREGGRRGEREGGRGRGREGRDMIMLYVTVRLCFLVNSSISYLMDQRTKCGLCYFVLL